MQPAHGRSPQSLTRCRERGRGGLTEPPVSARRWRRQIKRRRSSQGRSCNRRHRSNAGNVAQVATRDGRVVSRDFLWNPFERAHRVQIIVRLDPLRRPYFDTELRSLRILSAGSQTSAVPGCDSSSRSATRGDHEEDQFFFVILRAFVVGRCLASVAAYGHHEHVIDVHSANDRADLAVNVDLRRRNHGRHHRLQRVPAGFHFHLGPCVIAPESDLRVLGVALQASTTSTRCPTWCLSSSLSSSQ